MINSLMNNLNVFLNLTKRHFLVFFKNKIRVLYTLLVPIIILLVYILFLRNLELSTVQNILYELEVEATLELTTYINTLVDSWMLSGIIILSTITISIQTNNIIINDKENGFNRDFASSPIKNSYLIGSYFLFNFIVTMFLCLIVMLICFVYLAIMDEFFLTFIDFLIAFGVLTLSTATSTLLTIFICSFIKHESTLASIIAVFSTVAGFVIGAYMPLSMFPDWFRNICGFVPGTYSTDLMRFAFMATPLDGLSGLVSDLNLANGEELINNLFNSFGYEINLFGTNINVGYQALINVGFVVLFMILNIFLVKHITKVVADN